MLDILNRLEALRGPSSPSRDPLFAARLLELKRFQHLRLRRTYADLNRSPRYARAVAFFMDELYGEKDSTIRDRDLLRLYPTMQRLLPKFALEAVGKALELDVLAEEFDQSLTTLLDAGPITEARYLRAFREAGRRADRERQVLLMRDVGLGLERMVRTPLIYSTLKMLRRPAAAAGLGAMQQFLEAGFAAFRQMNGADYFLDTVAARETELIARVMDNVAAPFSIIDAWAGQAVP